MALPPRDHRISLAAAAELTRNFRDRLPPGGVKAQAFHADQVRDLLAQPGCVALRIYNGNNPDGTPALVLVGVDQNDQELTGGTLLEYGLPCPPFCTDDSALNA